MEVSYCIFPSRVYGCVVGGVTTDGRNTGFAAPPGPVNTILTTDSKYALEEERLYPRIKEPGDNCVSATIDLYGLRCVRKHLRTMHQRRPELYTPLTKDVEMWRDYPEIPWISPECPKYVNKANL